MITDLAGLPGWPWELLSHRQVLGKLAGVGWVPCGVGDWAVGLRSPDGTLVARVCPFDPAYSAFVDLCRQCAGNPWLPKVELAVELEGGGSVVFMEFVVSVDATVAGQIRDQWRAGTGGAEFQELRRAAQLIDARYRESVSWWDGFDLNPAHVRRAADGRLVLIDIFCLDGASLYGQILEDVSVVHRQIAPERMRYALDIPYIARECSESEIDALRTSWARAEP
jgi:hypothetical protein